MLGHAAEIKISYNASWYSFLPYVAASTCNTDHALAKFILTKSF